MMAQRIKKAVEAGMTTLDKAAIIQALEQEPRYMTPMGEAYFRCIDHQIVRDIGAGRIVKVPEYDFPVEEELVRLSGEEALSGIGQNCKCDVCK